MFWKKISVLEWRIGWRQTRMNTRRKGRQLSNSGMIMASGRHGVFNTYGESWMNKGEKWTGYEGWRRGRYKNDSRFLGLHNKREKGLLTERQKNEIEINYDWENSRRPLGVGHIWRTFKKINTGCSGQREQCEQSMEIKEFREWW